MEGVVAYAARVSEPTQAVPAPARAGAAAPPPTTTPPTTTPHEPAADPAAALVNEAMTKSGVLWIEVASELPDQPPRTWPAWFAWVAPTAYVVNGPGEQHLPWLPPEVKVILRSKDTGGRLLRVAARARLLSDADSQWAAAVEALATSRLNATDDAIYRWRTRCAVTALTPYGALLDHPGTAGPTSGAAPPPPSRATTTQWAPWHVRGRATARRARRAQRQGPPSPPD